MIDDGISEFKTDRIHQKVRKIIAFIEFPDILKSRFYGSPFLRIGFIVFEPLFDTGFFVFRLG